MSEPSTVASSPDLISESEAQSFIETQTLTETTEIKSNFKIPHRPRDFGKIDNKISNSKIDWSLTASYAQGVGSASNILNEVWGSLYRQKQKKSTNVEKLVCEHRGGRVYFCENKSQTGTSYDNIDDSEQQYDLLSNILPYHLRSAERISYVIGRKVLDQEAESESEPEVLDEKWLKKQLGIWIYGEEIEEVVKVQESEGDSTTNTIDNTEVPQETESSDSNPPPRPLESALNIWSKIHNNRQPESFRVSVKRSGKKSKGVISSASATQMVASLVSSNQKEFRLRSKRIIPPLSQTPISLHKNLFDLELQLHISDDEIMLSIPMLKQNINIHTVPSNIVNFTGGGRAGHSSGLHSAVAWAMGRSVMADLERNLIDNEDSNKDNIIRILDPMSGKGSLILQGLSQIKKSKNVTKNNSDSMCTQQKRQVQYHFIGVDKNPEQIAGFRLNVEDLGLGLDCNDSPKSCQYSEECNRILKDLRQKHKEGMKSPGREKIDQDENVIDESNLDSNTKDNYINKKNSANKKKNSDSNTLIKLDIFESSFEATSDPNNLNGNKFNCYIKDNSINILLCDVPFGQQHGSIEDNEAYLYPTFAKYMKRVLVSNSDSGNGEPGNSNPGKFCLLVSMSMKDCLVNSLLQNNLSITQLRPINLGPYMDACIIVGSNVNNNTNESSSCEIPPLSARLDWEPSIGRAGWLKEKMKERPTLIGAGVGKE